jgi:hypothetical protein
MWLKQRQNTTLWLKAPFEDDDGYNPYDSIIGGTSAYKPSPMKAPMETSSLGGIDFLDGRAPSVYQPPSFSGLNSPPKEVMKDLSNNFDKEDFKDIKTESNLLKKKRSRFESYESTYTKYQQEQSSESAKIDPDYPNPASNHQELV